MLGKIEFQIMLVNFFRKPYMKLPYTKHTAKMNNPSPQTTHNAFLHNPSPHTLHRLLSMFFQIQIPSLLDQHVQRKLAERSVMTMMMATPTKRVMMQMWVRQQTTNS